MASRNPARRLLAHFARRGRGSGYRPMARFLGEQGYHISDTTIGELYGRTRRGRDQDSPRNRARRADLETFIAERVRQDPQWIRRAGAPPPSQAPGRYKPRDVPGVATGRGVLRYDQIHIGVMPADPHARPLPRGIRPLKSGEVFAILLHAFTRWGEAVRIGDREIPTPFGIKFFGRFYGPAADEGELIGPTATTSTVQVVEIREMEGRAREPIRLRGQDREPTEAELRAAGLQIQQGIYSAPGHLAPALLGVPPNPQLTPGSHYAVALARLQDALRFARDAAARRRAEYEMAAYFAELCSGIAWHRVYGIAIWVGRTP